VAAAATAVAADIQDIQKMVANMHKMVAVESAMAAAAADATAAPSGVIAAAEAAASAAMAVAEEAASAVIVAVGESVTAVKRYHIKKAAMGAAVCYGFTLKGNKKWGKKLGRNGLCPKCSKNLQCVKQNLR
jgi:hypothetical protein